MTDSLYIAWRYIAYHKAKTTILILALTLIVFLPLGLRAWVEESERQLMSRATTTPLIIGAKGSSLDLAIAALYFEPKRIEDIKSHGGGLLDVHILRYTDAVIGN